jgi:hypothetical protein
MVRGSNPGRGEIFPIRLDLLRSGSRRFQTYEAGLSGTAGEDRDTARGVVPVLTATTADETAMCSCISG